MWWSSQSSGALQIRPLARRRAVAKGRWPAERLAAAQPPRRSGLGLGGAHARAAPWVIGLDLGKVHDPSAVVIMRRVSVDRPGLPHRDVEPMVVTPEIGKKQFPQD
jgi:hypothetical protein